MSENRLRSARVVLAVLFVCCMTPAVVEAQDCNGNGVADTADLTGGTSLDCNINGQPDECDLVPQLAELSAFTAPHSPNVSRLFSVNMATGQASTVGNLNQGGDFTSSLRTYGLDIEPETGQLFAVVMTSSTRLGADKSLVTINRLTGSAALVGTLGSNGQPFAHLSDLSFRDDGTLFGVSGGHNRVSLSSSGRLVEINLSNAAVSSPQFSGGLGGNQAIAFKSGSEFCYHSFSSSLERINLLTGTAQFIGGYPDRQQMLEFTSDGELLFGGRQELLRVNLQNGQTQTVGTFAFTPGDLAIQGAGRTFSVDCNVNGIPDECDLAEDSLDCNGNTVPDECDVAFPAGLGTHAYTVSFDAGVSRLFSVDVNNAMLSTIGALNQGGNISNSMRTHGLDRHPETGELFAIFTSSSTITAGFKRLAQVNKTTGAASLVGTLGTNSSSLTHITDLSFRDSTLLGVSGRAANGFGSSSGRLVEISLLNGSVTILPTLRGGTGGGQTIAVKPGTELCFHTFSTNIETLNLFDGDRTIIGVYPQRQSALDFTEDGVLLFGGRNSLMLVDQGVSGTQFVGLLPFAMGDLAFESAGAPSSEDCDDNQIPDECEPDGDQDGIPDACDEVTDLPDCNSNGVPDETDIAVGTSEDCNTNAVPDECDVAIEDCNFNGIPDLCEVILGLDPDCNTNDLPDICDVLSGDSLDCNINGLPDECEFPGCSGIRLGDMNCDNRVNGPDIQPFVQFFIGGRFTCQLDMDQDGLITIVDITIFVQILLSP